MKYELFRVVGLLLASWQAQSQPITTIALSGQAAAGTVAGVNYSGFSLKPSISANGTVAFIGDLTGSSIDGSNDRALWIGGAGSLNIVARKGAPASGSGGTYADFPITPAVNNSGQIGFIAKLSPGGAGVFRGSAAGVQGVAWTGLDGGSFETFEEFPGFVTMNNSGVVAFNATTSFFGILTSAGIYAGGPGSVSAIASAGDTGPGTSAAFLGFFAPSMNITGRTTFSALTSSDGENQDGDGIWAGPYNSISPVAVEGASAPGTNSTYAGGRLDIQTGAVERLGFLGGSLNAAGDIAFFGLINSPTDDRAIWVKKGNVVSLVARVGSTAPGFPVGTTFSDFKAPVAEVPHDPTLNNKGKIAMFAVVQGGGTTQADSEGIWLGDEHGLTLLERTGQHAPGTSSALFTHFQYPSLNGAGETAFLAEIGGQGIADGTTGLWATDIAGHTLLLALAGNSITVGANDHRLIAQIIGYFGNNNQDGAPEGLNDRGQVAFTAIFADGSSGVFVESIPYPCDANGDQRVDRADLGILLAHMNEHGLSVPGDFNYDGIVDFRDFQLIEQYFGTGRDQAPGPLASIDAVPEPVGIQAMSTLAVILLCGRRRRS